MMKIAFILFLLNAGSTPLVLGQDQNGFNQKLLVVSFDGLRQAYFNESPFLPWFSDFRKQGVYSDTVQSVFPSETFPNHFSIATGLYAESHGIVANSMYDPNFNATFVKSDNSPFWWAAEPIWVTAVRQGRRVAIAFWPGSEVKYPPGAYTPTYHRAFNLSFPFEKRIDETVEHLKNDNVQLAFTYHHQPDSDAHTFGVESKNVNDRLQQADWYLSYLLKRLDESDLGKDRLNVILCSDHGMVDLKNQIFLDDYVPSEDIERVPAYGAVVQIQPKPEKLESIFTRLNEASQTGQPFNVFKKADIPEELHYSNNDRIMDIVIICHLGTYMKTTRPASNVIGLHGFDPKFLPLKPMFMARGPAFKTGGYRAKNVFETKDIYAIIAHVTGVKPLATNASLELVADLFVESSATSALMPRRRLIMFTPLASFITLLVKF